MNALDIPRLRLHNTGLASSPFKAPAEVVEQLGAIQAQNFNAAKWTLGLRTQKATDESIEKAFNEGKLLRTHVMRMTWHFVLPEDIRWMLELTKPRVIRILSQSDVKLGITEDVISKSQSIFEESLIGRNFLTRTNLGDNLKKGGVQASGVRLGQILLHAELNALICNGPRRGGQLTYALVDEVARTYKRLSHDEALAKLASRYFMSHGPAQNVDFASWSGLSVKDADVGLSLIESNFAHSIFRGKIYWHSSDMENVSNSIRDLDSIDQAFLLSIYDEYVIAYRDRNDIIDDRDVKKVFSMGNFRSANVIIMDGKIAGTWNRVLKNDVVEIKINPLRTLDATEQEAVCKAAERYGEFVSKEILMS